MISVLRQHLSARNSNALTSALCLQCFDAVGWAAGRASGMYKTEWWGTGVVTCLERDADLHMAQLMPLLLTVSCFREIQIGFTFLVPAHPGSPGQRAVKQVCVCVCACVRACVHACVCFRTMQNYRSTVSWSNNAFTGQACKNKSPSPLYISYTLGY